MAPRGAKEARIEADLSFERLYRGHRSDVFRAALRELGNVHDAEDVTQAAFVDAYRAVLRGSRPEAPRAWLLAIAENVRHRRFRTAVRRPREEQLDPDAAPATEPTTEQANALRSALAALPPQQRDVFLLREIAGLSYDEIADGVGSTVGAVQMHLFRARKALQAELEPPLVSRRNRSLFVPLPDWLASLVTRSDAVVLTPRAAGALGAVVLAAGGATVGLATAPADARQPEVTARSASAPSAHAPLVKPAAAAARPVAVAARSSAKSPRTRAVSTAPKPRRSRLVAPAPTAAVAPAHPAGQAASIAPQPQRAPERAAAPAAPAASVAETVVSVRVVSIPSTPPVAAPVEQPTLPVLEEVGSALRTEPGAAAVAGADGPPLPALPLDTLPPVP